MVAAEVGETCVGTLSTDQAVVPKPRGPASGAPARSSRGGAALRKASA